VISRVLVFSALFGLVLGAAARAAWDLGVETGNVIAQYFSIVGIILTIVAEAQAYLQSRRAEPSWARDVVIGYIAGFAAGVLTYTSIIQGLGSLALASIGVGEAVLAALPTPMIINVLYGFLNVVVLNYALYAWRSLAEGLMIGFVVSYRSTPCVMFTLSLPVFIFSTAVTMYLSTVSYVYAAYVILALLPFGIVTGVLAGVAIGVLSTLGAYGLVKYLFSPLVTLVNNTIGAAVGEPVVTTEDVEAGAPLFMVTILASALFPFAGIERYLAMAVGLGLVVAYGSISTVAGVAPVVRRMRMVMGMLHVGLSTLALVLVILSGASTTIVQAALKDAASHIVGFDVTKLFG